MKKHTIDALSRQLSKHGYNVTATSKLIEDEKQAAVLKKRNKTRNSKNKVAQDAYRAQAILNAKKQKQKAISHYGGGCTVCGYSKCLKALHFHHIVPSTKEHKPSVLFKKSWDILIKELDKCILLCANCHAEEHDRNR